MIKGNNRNQHANHILFFFSMLLLSFNCSAQTTAPIRLNQLGFYPTAPKLAVVTGSISASTFHIVAENSTAVLFTGTLGEEKQSAYSSTKTRIADFSAFTKSGRFVILVDGVAPSYTFTISNDANKKAAIATLKGYYYQRVSMPLEEKYAGKWHRQAGHPDTAVYVHGSAATAQRPEGTIISTPGGWYDAGDYNKYIVNSGISMGTLLSAYEDFPVYYNSLQTNIPESSDKVPDILNEIIYNLRWMLTMQDPNDGGVYNKCTNAVFDGMVMPGITTLPRYVVQKGTAATLDFAAVAAQAARILRNFNKQLPKLADSCLAASEKAWEWALLNPALEYNQSAMNQKFKPEILTGGYGDRRFGDEWLWSAAELYLTTHDRKFYEVVDQHMKDSVNLPSWGNVAMLSYYSFLRFRHSLPASDSSTLRVMQNRMLYIANGYLQKAKNSAFQTIMGQSFRDFNWGGNSVAANEGIILINAYLLTRDKKYVDHALSNIDYILGRNATGYCFVTGIGSKPTMFPHHRQSTADGIADPVPGLVAGGPNPGMQDKCEYEFKEPETAYSDAVCSYASNEIAINWNAPVVYLINAIEALKNTVGYTGKK
ncbi:MAG: glycoside hydrolase family 9 protein [Chitinophagaceae bacterium]